MATEKKDFERIGDLFSNRDELAKEAEAKKESRGLAEQQRQAIKRKRISRPLDWLKPAKSGSRR